MKIVILLFSFLLCSLTSVAQKGYPPKDSTGKDFAYYFDVPFAKPQSWDSTVFFTKKYLDSFFVDKWKMIKLDSVSQTMKIRLTSKLKSRGMLKTTHKAVYTNCYMTYDYNIHYTPEGLHCKVKRIIHYYTYNEESSNMGSGAAKRSMVTSTKNIEIPMIQTDLKLYTKPVLKEVNEVITKKIQAYQAFKWVYVVPKDKYDDED